MKKTVLIFAFLFLLLACDDDGGRGNATLGRLPIKYPASIPYSYQNAAGEMPFISSVVPVPDEARKRVAEGIKTQIRATKAKFPHWQKWRDVSDYNVLFIEPDGHHPEYGFPELNVGGTISAGTVIGIPGQKVSPVNIVLPHQQAGGWKYLDYLENAARYESEHNAELNDMQIFNQYTGPNDYHPHHLTPEESQTRGFAAMRQPNFKCGVKVTK